jgi:transposase
MTEEERWDIVNFQRAVSVGFQTRILTPQVVPGRPSLTKNVFQVHGIDERGKAVLKKQLRRDQMATFFVNLPPCLIGMEACGSAHHWARKLQSMGHTVQSMAPQFVKPYDKTKKNDAADAEAICEVVGRPNMRFVPIKNIEQQTVPIT